MRDEAILTKTITALNANSAYYKDLAQRLESLLAEMEHSSTSPESDLVLRLRLLLDEARGYIAD